MLSVYRRILLTSEVLQPRCINQSRGLRGRVKIFRQELPRYRKNLSKLPPLTKFLTQNMKPSSNKLAAFNELRQEKLEIYKEYLPDRSNTNLIEALFHPDNNEIDELLRIIDHNLVTMNSFYVGVSFEVINDSIELDLCHPSTIAAAPEFKRLCEKSIYKLRFFESDELLKVIKCLVNVGVPEDTLIVQGTLQMIRHLINDFEIQELQALSAILDQVEPSKEPDVKKSLLPAIKRAIPISIQRKSELRMLPDDDSNEREVKNPSP